jgi:hypothetical protein
MKRRKRLLLQAALLASPAACSLLMNPPTGQCQRHEDCAAFGASFACAPDAVCVELPGITLAAADAGACESDTDCASTHGLALCRQGGCRTLNNPDVGCVSSGWGTTAPSDGAAVFPIGMLVPGTELADDGSGKSISGAVGTAIGELNRVREEQRLLAGASASRFPSAMLPAVVGVACDEARPEALAYLVDTLQLNVIVGATRSDAIRPVLIKTADRALFVAPFADAPSLAREVDDAGAYLLSCKPNRQHLRAYLLEAVDEARNLITSLGAPGMEPISPALAVSNDVATQRFAEGFNDGALAAAGLRRVLYATEAGGLGLVSALRAIKPAANLVVAASAEDAWEDNIAAYDSATYGSLGFYPYYLLADKRWALYNQVLRDQATAKGFPPQYARLLGLDYHRDVDSTLFYEEFSNAFFAETGSQVEPNLEYVYDCTYLAIYAAVAAGQRFPEPLHQLSAEAIASGLGALYGGGPRLPVRALNVAQVIASVLGRQGQDAAVDLVGTSGALDLERELPRDGLSTSDGQYWAAGAADGELYCIDDVQKVFCNTGIVFPAGGGPPVRGESTCSCLGGN